MEFMGIFPVNLQKKNLKIKEGFYFPFHFTPSKKTGPPFCIKKTTKSRRKDGVSATTSSLTSSSAESDISL
jgi:hypothetical protein